MLYVIDISTPESFERHSHSEAFLGEFTKELNKATISCVIFDRLCVRMEQLGFAWMGFCEIGCWKFFVK
jgi:hypothetical protein